MSTHGITKGTSSTMNHSRTRRLSALTIAAFAAAVCLAACGSSSSSSSSASAAASASSSSTSSGSTSGGTVNRATLVACLKAHGVTLPARPAGAPPAGGGGYGGYGRGPGFFGGGGGAGSRFANPKFRAALEACGGANFRGGGFAGRRFTFSHTAVDNFVACVKQHGFNMPAPNFSGKGPIFPATIEKNSKFLAASKACASDLRAPATGTNTATSSASTA